MKTEQLRDELALVIAQFFAPSDTPEMAAQAVIDHIAPMMRKAALALRYGSYYRFDNEDVVQLFKQALESFPEEWRK